MLKAGPASSDPCSQVGDLAELKDGWLRDPLRFHIFRALYGDTLAELGSSAGKSRGARRIGPAVKMQFCKGKISPHRPSVG